MIQRYDANGFPLPDVPTDNNFNVDFGREANYALRGPKSAVADLEAAAVTNNTSTDRTPASGKYVYNSSTGEYIWVPAGTTAPATAGLSAAQGYQERGGGGRGEGMSSDNSYGPNSSPMSNSIDGSLGYRALDAYGNFLGGILPGGIFAQALAQQMNPAQVAAASEKAAQAQKDAVEGYSSGKMFGAPPSAPSTYGGANYSGIGGTTSQTGAGSTTNMGKDPSQAQGLGAVDKNDRGYLREAAMNAEADSNRAYQAAVNEGARGETGGGYGGVDASGRSDGPNGPEGRGDVGGDRGGWGRGGGYAQGGISSLAKGGIGDLGGYSDGGRLLRGPGDGVSDSIPANIGGKRPARLADGEFVVPARIVSELGNGSTEAGARKLYAMLDRIQAGRKKSIGKGKVAANSRASKHLPA